jgi:hypothetical protein
VYAEHLKWYDSFHKTNYKGITVARTGYQGKDSEDRIAPDSTDRIGQLEQDNHYAHDNEYINRNKHTERSFFYWPTFCKKANCFVSTLLKQYFKKKRGWTFQNNLISGSFL